MPIPSDKKILTTLEARQYLGERLGREKPVSYDTLRRYRQDGRLHPASQVGSNEMLYDRDELDRLLAGEQFDGPRLVMPAMMSHFEKFVREILRLEPLSEFLEETPAFTSIPAQPAILLQVPTGTLAVRRLLLQSGRKPDDQHWTRWRTSENWYNPAFVDEAMLAEMQQSAAFNTMEAIRDRYGVTVRKVLIRVRSRIPTAGEAKLLEMSPQHSVLEMDRVSMTEDKKRIVMIHHLVFVASRCEIEWEQDVNLW